MEHLLQIVIPTYNRTAQLERVLCSISAFSKIDEDSRVCVDIFDNSDVEKQEDNHCIIPSHIAHHRNQKNLGYSVNVQLCLASNRARYIWLVSDDDELIVDNIIKLIDYLEELPEEVCGVSLSYEVPNLYSEEYDLISCLVKNGREIAKLKESMNLDRVPFDFISGFIIRSDILRRFDARDLWKDSLYMQSVIYCGALKPDDLISFYELPVVRWRGDDSLRWPLTQLFDDRNHIRDILLIRHNVSLNNILLIRNLLKWALLSRIGLLKNTTIEKDRFNLFFKINSYINVPNLCLSIFLILPKGLARVCILFCLSLFGNRRSFNGIICKYKANINRLRSKI